jgi:hypothetical protein
MTVYSVSGDTEPTSYFGTRVEAFKDGRARSLADPDLTVQVERCQLVPMTKETILRLLNYAGGHVESSQLVGAFLAGKLQPLEPIERAQGVRP